MEIKFVPLAIILIIAVGLINVAIADDDYDYEYLAVCDSRCEMRNRLNPFVEGCDNCCRQRGFRKGKCRGFGWSYCMCKHHNPLRRIFNSILNNQLNG